jgi:hypothetical protein
MWFRGRYIQHRSESPGLIARDHCLAYPGRGKTNDSFTGVSPDCLSTGMGTLTCACMC